MTQVAAHAAEAAGAGRRSSPGRLLLAALSWLPIVAYVGVALARLRYPYDLQWLEGGAVELTRRVGQGESLYVEPSLDFTGWPYPPLFFWVAASASGIVGEGYVALRLVSFLASLAAMALIAGIVRRHAASWLPGLVAAGLFAGTYLLGGAWLDLGRVDSLFLALLLGAVVLADRARSPWSGVAVGVVLLASFLTKQNALLVAVPLLACLVVVRRRVGVTASLVLSVGVIGSVLLGDARTDGWYSYYVVRELLGQPVEARWVVGFWAWDLVAPLLPALLLVGWWVRDLRRGGPGGTDALRPSAVVLAAVVGLLGAAWAGRLHSGGFANVAIPAYAAVAVLSGLAVARAVETAGSPRPTRAPSTAVLAAGLALQLAVLLVPWRGALPWTLVPGGGDVAAGDRLVAALDRLPGRVIVPVHPHLLTQAGRPTTAHSLALGDVLRGPDGRAKDAVRADLVTALDDVSVVVLDTPGEASMFEPALSRDFVRVDGDVLAVLYGDGEVLRPRTDLAIRPTDVWVRPELVTQVEAALAASATGTDP